MMKPMKPLPRVPEHSAINITIKKKRHSNRLILPVVALCILLLLLSFRPKSLVVQQEHRKQEKTSKLPVANTSTTTSAPAFATTGAPTGAPTEAPTSAESSTSPGTNKDDGPFMELPNILLIGGQKCGSSAVADWLFKQGVCGGEVFDNEPVWYKKEIHFFDNFDRWSQGIQFYSKRFKHCYAKKTSLGRAIRMDATPATLNFPDRVHEIYKDYPNQMKKLKIMLMVRDPVARALSLYNHKKGDVLTNRASDKKNPLWIEDVLHKDGSIKSFGEYTNSSLLTNFGTIVDAGLFAGHLSWWLQYFSPEQILVLSYEELKANTAKFQWRVKEFLNAAHFKDDGAMAADNEKSGGQKTKYMSCETQEILQQKYEPEYALFYQLMEKKEQPWMQEKPFPTFKLSKCVAVEQGAELPVDNTTVVEG